MYSPTQGRFITQDPIGFAAGDVNLYRFVGNHPASATDPSGLAEDDPWPWTRANRDILAKLPPADRSPAAVPGGNQPVRLNTNKYGSFDVKMVPFQRATGRLNIAGLSGTVEFTPSGGCPECKEIKLIQIIRIVDDSDETWTTDRLTGTNGAFQLMPPKAGTALRTVFDAVYQPGWFVDVSEQEIKRNGNPKTPFYQDNFVNLSNRDGKKLQGKPPEPTILYDLPHTSQGEDRFEFETAAYCVDTKQFLGSVRWGFSTRFDKNFNPLAEPLPVFHGHVRDVPTPSFFEALSRFNNYYGIK